jgi:hypothetical protein
LKEALSIDLNALSEKIEPTSAQQSKEISRWPTSDSRLQITQVNVLNAEGKPAFVVNTGDPIEVDIEIIANETGTYDCAFVILLFSEDGRWIARQCSEVFTFHMTANQRKSARLVYDSILLGNGKFVFSAAIYKTLDLHDLSTAVYYDLLSRSFEFQVLAEYKDDQSLICHPCKWELSDTEVKLSADCSA